MLIGVIDHDFGNFSHWNCAIHFWLLSKSLLIRVSWYVKPRTIQHARPMWDVKRTIRFFWINDHYFGDCYRSIGAFHRVSFESPFQSAHPDVNCRGWFNADTVKSFVKRTCSFLFAKLFRIMFPSCGRRWMDPVGKGDAAPIIWFLKTTYPVGVEIFF